MAVRNVANVRGPREHLSLDLPAGNTPSEWREDASGHNFFTMLLHIVMKKPASPHFATPSDFSEFLCHLFTVITRKAN